MAFLAIARKRKKWQSAGHPPRSPFATRHQRLPSGPLSFTHQQAYNLSQREIQAIKSVF
ncbi:hypothetical protein MTX25_07550 [Bradyrhizobium sp. ISRA432]|uniref:hypothetical protein n=1 Tax=Bradyrhizobium sp. ISRA430 TaxID=2866192 RepID=UPI0024790751|nr:hypothetical protein [Bradyrhizobium sp. ISRA430]WGR77590.1 hypothetical protein MTX21_32500 [Bradyrhizobium sp. ISRA430]WGR87996.1 hypothetical protein MTX25_07550 [Bradyrhizobium sp. ISRA432]